MSFFFEIENANILARSGACGICLEPLSTSSKEGELQPMVVGHDTRHGFHQPCIDKYVNSCAEKKIELLCPVCREAVHYSASDLSAHRHRSGIKIALSGLAVAEIVALGSNLAVIANSFGKANFSAIVGTVLACFVFQTAVIVAIAKTVLDKFPT